MNSCTSTRIRAVYILTLFYLVVITGCVPQAGNTSRVKAEDVIVSSDVQKTFDHAIELLEQEQYDTAITLLNNVIEQEKRLTAPYINLAMAYRQKGEDKLAEENFLKALAIDQADPVANNELGILYRKQGKFEDAKKVYTNALAENPDYLPVIKNLGILCDIYMRDPQCALEQFEKYQQQMPEDKTIEIWIADLKTRM
ncbi:MAG: tetratricopeptide repeat protein [Thiotrichales bacterium]|nr:MAG: tetratricopeptide repeat protein [Thiotrichales bacterium]